MPMQPVLRLLINRGAVRRLQHARSLDEAVGMVERHRATVLWGITSFVRRTIIQTTELGADFSSVRMCGVTGEASTPEMREDIRQRLRVGVEKPIIFDRYGSTEPAAWRNAMRMATGTTPRQPSVPRGGRPGYWAAPPDGERGALQLRNSTGAEPALLDTWLETSSA